MITKALKFIDQVRQEFYKITWSTRKNTLMVTGIVFLLVFLTSLYFFVLDLGLSWVVNLFLTIGS